MHKYIKKMQSEFSNSGLMPIFEIPVESISDNSKDWICCDVSFQGNSIVAQRDAVSTREKKSRFIASSKVVCKNHLSLDEHLQELYSELLNDICNGNLYNLSEGN